MINPKQLLDDLKGLLRLLEGDIRNRSDENSEINEQLITQYRDAFEAKRTAQAFTAWRDDYITQVAVAWILSCVFVRFIEDNRLVDESESKPRVWISGPSERLQLAKDNYLIFFRENPRKSDREYLLHVFRSAVNPTGRRMIGVIADLFDEKHNLVWKLGPSGDGANALLEFWWKIDASSGELVRDFTDDSWGTRFLGDLYQDLSESAKEKYALLQTPEFVEEFILDRTLTLAISEFGYEQVRLIDPTCGSGHFILGAFARLFNVWSRKHPGLNAPARVQKALASVYGVDLNPYAVRIARFRLLVAALRASGFTRLHELPAFAINLATGDSLLHGEHPALRRQDVMEHAPGGHYYVTEDKVRLEEILKVSYFHAVVGNPPYIKVKDSELNKAYRDLFQSCRGTYSLVVPFLERFFDLAVSGNSDHSGGYVGMIASNAFMKRQFGKKLIEQYMPKWNLTHVIDTGGAYIPGHGTLTVILLGQNQKPVTETIRTVMGIKGEPGTPPDPAQGQVWTSIVKNIDLSGVRTEFVSIGDTARSKFHKHPWSIGGGGAAELKADIEDNATKILSELIEPPIGRAVRIGQEEIFMFNEPRKRHSLCPETEFRGFLRGESIRDWAASVAWWVWYPYGCEGKDSKMLRELWRWRTVLANRATFQGSLANAGLEWFDYQQHTASAYLTPLSISFAEVATHNHFVLDRGGKVFKQTAPVIKLPANANEDEHLALLGLLNSSTGCFWMKQVFQNKGSTVDEQGARQTTSPFENFYQYGSTGLKQFPISEGRPLDLARSLDREAQRLQSLSPSSLAQHSAPNSKEWQQAKEDSELTLTRMIALQEELDWQCYKFYGLLDEELTIPDDKVPAIQLGQRAFEIVMGRRIEKGELETTWFERHRSMPITQLPTNWPEDYCRIVKRRIDVIEQDSNIRILEQPEYKRRWNAPSWSKQAERTLREWLLTRLEESQYWSSERLSTIGQLTDRIRTDSHFMQVGEMYSGSDHFDLSTLIDDLVRAEAVPFLAALRYKQSGMRKRKAWEETWRLQRIEDEIDSRTRLDEDDSQKLTIECAKKLKSEAVGIIPVPPKYKSEDFQDQNSWRHRGKLDVTKERFISFPYCERDTDQSLVIGWAGWNHLQRAKAIAAYYQQMKAEEGWDADRLVPLLVGLVELLPWLFQWHNEIDSNFRLRMSEFYQEFVDTESRQFGFTRDQLRNWTPPVSVTQRRNRSRN